jgi:hypothetical protein
LVICENYELSESGKVKNLPVRIWIEVLEKIGKSWEIWPHQWKNEQRLMLTKTTYCAFNPA